jgi:hypothetical protein
VKLKAIVTDYTNYLDTIDIRQEVSNQLVCKCLLVRRIIPVGGD